MCAGMSLLRETVSAAVDLRFWRNDEGGFARDTIERKIRRSRRLSVARATA